MSETILRAQTQNYITLEQIKTFDPTIIFAIPRLTVVSALLHTPDTVNLTDPDNAFRWFRAKVGKMRRIQEDLKALTEGQVRMLERWLADSEEEMPSGEAGEKELEGPGGSGEREGDKAETAFGESDINLEEEGSPNAKNGKEDKPVKIYNSPQDARLAAQADKSHPDHIVAKLFLAICSVSDELVRMREFVSMMQSVFMMYN
jgi:hypothetical protein